MLEQELFRKVIDIVEKYTEVSPERKKAYAEAALKFRLPYWDYHRARDYRAQFPGVVHEDVNRKGTTFYPYDFCVPQILTLETLKVKMWPDDKLQTIDNPLSGFKFRKYAPDGIPDSDWKIRGFDVSDYGSTRYCIANVHQPSDPGRDQTSRWPDVPMERGFKSSVQTLNCSVNELREDTIRMSLNFVENGAYNDYLSYSTARAPTAKDPLDGKSAVGSLEGVHGNYHGLVGGEGHMSSVLTAAFDPIFFLHHW
jgi:tyrosinase